MNETIERHGQVIGFHAGRARVRLDDAPGCAQCASRVACAAGETKSSVIDVILPAGACAGAGDRVTLAVSSTALTLAALQGYLLPPVALLAGAIAASLVCASDGVAVLGAAVGLGAGLVLVRRLSKPALGSHFSAASCRPPCIPGELP